MTLYQFRSLPKDMQAQLVKQKGSYLFGRTTRHAYVKLYQLDHMYVELYFDKKMSFVAIVNAFEDTERLEPYLQLLDVSELQQLLL